MYIEQYNRADYTNMYSVQCAMYVEQYIRADNTNMYSVQCTMYIEQYMRIVLKNLRVVLILYVIQSKIYKIKM